MTAPGELLHLATGGGLLAPGDPLLLEILAELESDDPLPALREELAAYCGKDAPTALFDDITAARERAARAARTNGRPLVVVAGGETAGITGAVEVVPLEHLTQITELMIARADEIACVLLEPRGELAILRTIAAGAADMGVPLFLDESRTASRLTARTVSEEADIGAEVIVLGTSLGCGLPFGAVVGLTEPGARCDTDTARTVRAALRRLASAGVHEELSHAGVALRARFAAACRRLDLKGRLLGPAALMRLAFADQDNVAGPRIAVQFLAELRTLGVDAHEDVALPVGLDPSRAERITVAFEAALARVRTQLVEHNATVSDDLPWVFEAGPERMRRRGLTRFQHPRQAAAAIETEVDGLRLSIAAGPLGPTTSVGFLSREPLRGDFELRVRVDLDPWHPGPDGAAFALFVQDVATGTRTQALWVSLPGAATGFAVAATFEGRENDGHRGAPRGGWLRIVRAGDELTVACADDADEPTDWVEIARRRPAPRGECRFGCRIAARVQSEGLSALVRALVIVGVD